MTQNIQGKDFVNYTLSQYFIYLILLKNAMDTLKLGIDPSFACRRYSHLFKNSRTLYGEYSLSKHQGKSRVDPRELRTKNCYRKNLTQDIVISEI